MRRGEWQHSIGGDLNGRTLGVVGLGRLGARVAAIGTAFGMRVLAWSTHLDPERAAEHGVLAVDKEELFSASDVITVHYKLSERSTGLVGAAELARMKPTALLVNTSRGPLVDTPALVAALREGRIMRRGAGRLRHRAAAPAGRAAHPAEHAAHPAPRLCHGGHVRRLLPAGRRGHRGLPRRDAAAGADVLRPRPPRPVTPSPGRGDPPPGKDR